MNEKLETLIAVAVISVLLTAAVGIVYFHSKKERIVTDYPKWKQEKVNLESELKNLPIPDQTKQSDLDDFSRPGVKILVTRTFETELKRSEFLESMNQELLKNGWKFYRQQDENHFYSYKYCRGSYQSSLSHQKRLKIFAEQTDIWNLSYSYDFEKYGYEKRDQTTNVCNETE